MYRGERVGNTSCAISGSSLSLLLAQEGVRFLQCSYDEHEQRCNRCYGKKYFHAPRIAWNPTPAFCNELTAAKQLCKAPFIPEG